jgi:hypothetical protein
VGIVTLDDRLKALSTHYTQPTITARSAIDAGEGDSARLLDDIAAFLDRFVVLTVDQARTIALWVVHTHAFEAADSTPYLNIRSAEKRSGKTRLLEVLELLVAKPWRTGRTSVAALIRKISDEHCTMLLDESDAAFSEKVYADALRGVLNDGYRRGGNTTLCVGQGANIKTKSFQVFSPKAIAGIGKHLPDTVADRSIVIELRRRMRAESVERFRERTVTPAADALRKRVERWASASMERLREIWPEPLDAIDDRAENIWEPLFAIAEVAGPQWRANARAAAIVFCGARDDEDAKDGSAGIALLRDTKRAFGDSDRLHTNTLLERLTSDEFAESPWPTWHHGKPLTARALAKMLRSYGIRSRQTKIEGENRNGYFRDAFEDPWRRYAALSSDLSSTASTALIFQGENAKRAPSTITDGRGSQNAETDGKIKPVDQVEDSVLRRDGVEPSAAEWPDIIDSW